MSEYLSINTGTGPKVAVDLVGDTTYQLIKLMVGGSGVANYVDFGQANMANSIPVVLPTDQATIPVSVVAFSPKIATVQVIDEVIKVTTVLGTVAVSGGGGGAQYPIGTTGMGATGTGTIIIGIQSGATTGRGLLLTTTGGLPHVATMSYLATGTVDVINVLTVGTVSNVLDVATVSNTVVVTGSVSSINVLTVGTVSNILTVTTVLGTVAISGTNTAIPYPHTIFTGGHLLAPTANTPTQFPSVPCKKVFLSADQTNQDVVVVGASDVTANAGTRNGVVLYPAQSIQIAVSNISLMYLVATTNSEGVSYAVIS